MPATEATIASAAFSLQNWVEAGSVIDASSETALYPASHVANPHRGKRYRSTSSAVDQTITVDFGQSRLPKALVLVDHNLTSGTVEWRLASDSSISSDVRVWTVDVYTANKTNRTLRFYLDAPDSLSASAQRFGQLTLKAGTTTDPHHELGVLWIGDVVEVTPSSGVDMKTTNNSSFSESYSGSAYVDPQRVVREVRFEVEFLTIAETYALQERLDDAASRHIVFDLHASSSDSSVKAAGCFYGRLGRRNPISASLIGGQQNSLSIDFEEAPG